MPCEASASQQHLLCFACQFRLAITSTKKSQRYGFIWADGELHSQSSCARSELRQAPREAHCEYPCDGSIGALQDDGLPYNEHHAPEHVRRRLAEAQKGPGWFGNTYKNPALLELEAEQAELLQNPGRRREWPQHTVGTKHVAEKHTLRISSAFVSFREKLDITCTGSSQDHAPGTPPLCGLLTDLLPAFLPCPLALPAHSLPGHQHRQHDADWWPQGWLRVRQHRRC